MIVFTRETGLHSLRSRGIFVIYRGIQYTVMATAEPDVWEWRYEIGDQVKTGRTQTRLPALAARRVKSKIDAVLRITKPSESVPRERAEAGQISAHLT
jgi:hypothetical protein